MSGIKGFIGAVDVSCDRLFLSFVVKNDHTSEKPVQYKDYSLASNNIQRIAVSSHHHPNVNIRCTRFSSVESWRRPKENRENRLSRFHCR